MLVALLAVSLATSACAPTTPAARRTRVAAATATPAPYLHCCPIQRRAYAHLAALGNSITNGDGLNPGEKTFVFLLSGQLGSLTVFSQGLSGKQTAAADAWLLASGGLPTSGDLDIIESGTNDDYLGTDPTIHPTPLATFGAQYLKLLSDMEARVPAPVEICVGIWGSESQLNSLGLGAADYDRVIQQECQQQATNVHITTEFVSIEALYENPALHNGFHPNEAGQQAIASAIKAVLP